MKIVRAYRSACGWWNMSLPAFWEDRTFPINICESLFTLSLEWSHVRSFPCGHISKTTNLGMLCWHLIGWKGGSLKAHIRCKFDIWSIHLQIRRRRELLSWLSFHTLSMCTNLANFMTNLHLWRNVVGAKGCYSNCVNPPVVKLFFCFCCNI